MTNVRTQCCYTFPLDTHNLTHLHTHTTIIYKLTFFYSEHRFPISTNGILCKLPTMERFTGFTRKILLYLSYRLLQIVYLPHPRSVHHSPLQYTFVMVVVPLRSMVEKVDEHVSIFYSTYRSPVFGVVQPGRIPVPIPMLFLWPKIHVVFLFFGGLFKIFFESEKKNGKLKIIEIRIR